MAPLICSTGSFWMWELEKSLGVIAEAGFDSIELMVTRDPRTQTPGSVTHLSGQAGLSVAAIHAPMLVVTRNVWGPSFRPIIERSVAMAAELGAPVVIVHPPYIWELRYQAWLLRELDRYSAESGVAIAVENMFRLWVGAAPIRGHRWMSPADLARFHQVTLDTSHCGVDDFDILEALDILGERIAHVHISDSHSNRRDNHALPGTGTLPLDRFVKRLPAIGFRGALSLELDMRDYSDDTHAAVRALKGARAFCQDHLG